MSEPPRNTVPPSLTKTVFSSFSRGVKRWCQIVGAGYTVYFIAGMITTRKLSQSKMALPNDIIIEVDMEKGLNEKISSPFAALTEKPRITVKEFVDTLHTASKDPRVRGVVINLPAAATVGGVAQLQEIRDSVQEFNKTNKFSIAFSETFTQGNYYLASSCSKVFLQPSGYLRLTGIHSYHPFFKETLNKLEISPRFDHTGNHKTYSNMFTQREFTPEHRESVALIVNSVFNRMINGISTLRNVPETMVKHSVDHGPLSSNEALAAKLIDDLKYYDEVLAEAKLLSGPKAEVVPFINYARATKSVAPTKISLVPSSFEVTTSTASTDADKKDEKGTNPAMPGMEKIALIYAVGEINNEMTDKSGITPKRMKKAFEAALKDTFVKAIVIRVDSPGGDALSSDTIWRYVVSAQQQGKKVIASVGNVAASGGYYIISPCDTIVAQPSSITGSIGVVGGKFVANKFLENKLGVTFDDVTIGQNAAMESFLRDFNPSEREQFHKHINEIYDRFLTVVSDGRKMSKETVKEIAGGRVYTAEIAQTIGLVDELGGLNKAVDVAKKLISNEAAKVEIFPRQLSLWEQILETVRGGEADIPRIQYSFKDMINSEDFSRTPFATLLPFINQMLDSTPGHLPQLIVPEPLPQIDDTAHKNRE